jgi:2',3'-cyclic-nucleotide 2'-phosphodiesterase/3'-nucleotidase
MNFKRLKNCFNYAILSVLLTAALSAQTINIKLIETSDVHGTIFPFDLLNDTTASSSLAQVHTYVNVQRGQLNQEVILLDNGDILQGDPTVYYYSFVDTNSKHIYANVMNFMSYDVATVGNHDIETGHAVYDKFKKEINFPWLAANAINTETNEPYFLPYTVIERNGIKIAVLGLITPAIPNWLPENIWKGMKLSDMIESAKIWVPIIQKKEKPDLLIGLFHSGIDYTYNNETAETYKNENASQLVAEQVPGFDVVFVGHDHAGWNYEVADSEGDSVLILGTLSNAKTVAVANIIMEYDSSKGGWEKRNASGELVEIKNYKPDDMFMSKYLMTLNQIENYVAQPVVQITKSISTRESMFGPSAFMDIIHVAQLDMTGADLSFASPLSFNTTIDSGWIRVRDMFKLYKYENLLYTMELSGQEVKDYLEYSYGRWFNQMENEKDDLLKFKKDESGNLIFSDRYGTPLLEESYYNYSSAFGINYTIDVTKAAGERINVISFFDGSSFSMDGKYTVAINSYRGNGGGGHLTRGAGIPKGEIANRIISSTDKDLRFHIMKWLKKMKLIYPNQVNNWKVIPEEWWKKATLKDYTLMFGETVLINQQID